jgi:signal transduction histidine kinase
VTKSDGGAVADEPVLEARPLAQIRLEQDEPAFELDPGQRGAVSTEVEAVGVGSTLEFAANAHSDQTTPERPSEVRGHGAAYAWGVDRMFGADWLRRLQGVTDAALAHLQLDELLAALLSRTRDALEADTCAVLLLDEETNELVARAAIGIEEEVERGVRIPVGRGFAGRIAVERQPVVIFDVDHADIVNPILREKGIQSLLGAPLLVEGRVVGVMHVGSLTPRVFSDEDITFLHVVADRVAIAIDHARLFEAERTARVRLENVQRVLDAALEHLDLEDLLNELLLRTRDILGTDTAAILLLDDRGKDLVARAAVGLEEEVERGVRVPVGRGFAGRVAAEKRPIVLPDVERADIHNPILREKGIKSLLGAPLLARGEVVGVLHVGTLTPRKFTPDDVQLLQLVAERAGLALDRARVYEDLLHLDRLKLDFVAVASHELRTPATSVYGILTTLRERRESLDPGQRAELEEVLWEQSDRMRRLIEQLLDLSRLDARAHAIDPQPLRVREVVDDVVASLARHRESDVIVDVDGELDAFVDPVAFDRALTNLLSNALHHGEPPVRVTAERGERQLLVAVVDAGPGVPPELVPRLFERFERGVEGSGSGLGLSIARAYARAHGGDVVYDSETNGARFELVLPFSA